MDTLTHGLLGLAVGACPMPRSVGARDDSPSAHRAGLLVAVLAAELPDVDYLWPSADPVLQTLAAHRGLTHALVFTPVIALGAVALTKLVFRQAALVPLAVRALAAVVVAHLLPDLWTGWGTRLLLPFSERRFALDWTMVVDPLFTLPLLVGATWALLRRHQWRRALLGGAAASCLYLALRIVTAHHLDGVVRAAHPRAESVRVFPSPLSVLRWRYVVTEAGRYLAGEVALGRSPETQARVLATGEGGMPPDLAAVPTVREALAWARFPVVTVDPAGAGARRVRIADLRYHLRGRPTLAFEVTVSADGRVLAARLDRGGSARDLFRRWREPADETAPPPPPR